MPNERKNPPPPPPPPGGAKPGGTKPGGAGGVKPNDGNQNPPQNQIRRAAGVGGVGTHWIA
jgi:hypothetical protein